MDAYSILSWAILSKICVLCFICFTCLDQKLVTQAKNGLPFQFTKLSPWYAANLKRILIKLPILKSILVLLTGIKMKVLSVIPGTPRFLDLPLVVYIWAVVLRDKNKVWTLRINTGWLVRSGHPPNEMEWSEYIKNA